MKDIKPPRWAQDFIEWYCKPQLAEDLIGDLNEYFERNVERIGVRRARIIYAIDAVKFLRPYTIRAPKYINLLINWIMLGSYLKTSGRNVMRNKLFSSINIIGLAISMSVGLMLIAFVHDLFSYDKFHERGDRIYRLTSLPSFNHELSNKFASTSVKAGRLIREKVSGVEETTIIRGNFGGDAKFDDKVIPVEGIWADPSFLRMFSFPMLKGDPATALKDPYSIVLTETSAKKLFGDGEALGRIISFDTLDYHVTGVLKDIPFFSYLRFESLGSFVTIENLKKDDKFFNTWGNMWSNHVFVQLPPDSDLASVQRQLDAIAAEENKVDENTQISLGLQPLHQMVLGPDLSNAHGPGMPILVVWIIAGLALVVILSACFNYTNLSIARSLRRFKEVGLRKVIGAGKGQVRQQFLAEAIIVSLAALLFSFVIFLTLRVQFLNMAPELPNMVKLELTPAMVIAFIGFAVAVGILAGFMPAFFFAKVNIIQALKNTSTVKVFRHLNVRRSLVVVQYTLTLIFITGTFVAYTQYKEMLAFDLGFKTDNILNIKMIGNNPERLVRKLEEMPEVTDISRSLMITSVGSYWGGHVKYQDSKDSTRVWYNVVDENYFPLHEHKLVAGGNFVARPTTKEATSEIIVNQQLIKRFNVGGNDPEKAIGEELEVDGKKLKIVGVLQDFHYGKVDSPIDPVAFTFWTEKDDGYLNVKVKSEDILGTMARLETAWKSIDHVHPFDAKFYKDSIEKAYSEMSAMIKIIGFLSFLAISIASMGLFGMVVFTTETRLKEISIRKVMGASSGNLVFLLSRGFFILLCISAAIAIPITYLFFEGVVLSNFPYHSPIGVVELFGGLLCVLVIAFIMIGSQTLKATRSNPAQVLRSE